MNALTRIMVSAAALSLMSACTVLPAKQQVAEKQPPEIYLQPYSAKYSAQLAEQLVDNASVRLSGVKVGITNLVGVTGQYNESSALSQVLSEQLVQELHRRELSVLDFKTTDFIRVTPNGDFALTRDYMELDEIMPITHVMVDFSRIIVMVSWQTLVWSISIPKMSLV